MATRTIRLHEAAPASGGLGSVATATRGSCSSSGDLLKCARHGNGKVVTGLRDGTGLVVVLVDLQ